MLFHCLRNIWGNEGLKQHFPKSWELWWHMTWFLTVGGKKFAQASSWDHTEDSCYFLSHHECQQHHAEKQLWPSSTSGCLHPAIAPGTSWISYASTIQRCTGSPISCEGMPRLVSTAPQLAFKGRPQDTERKRSYFNFIGLLRFPFSEVQVTISISLEGTVGDLTWVIIHTRTHNDYYWFHILYKNLSKAK